jgi:hypothetical protein
MAMTIRAGPIVHAPVVTKHHGRSRRTGERGAAVFVVVMAITLLTAVGLFAAHSATLVDQAAGYSRVARQAQYMTEYGALLTIAELGSGAADAYVKRIRESTELCQATSGLSGYARCSRTSRSGTRRTARS